MASESLAEIQHNVHHMYLKEFDVAIDPQELFDFHYSLWRAGKIDFAITCYPSVDEELKKRGVPSYWVSPTKTEIYHTVQLLQRRSKRPTIKRHKLVQSCLKLRTLIH